MHVGQGGERGLRTLLSSRLWGLARCTPHVPGLREASATGCELALLRRVPFPGVQGRQHTYEDTYRLLKSYSDMKGFREMWELCARKDKALILGAWIATVFLSCLRLIIQDPMHTNGVGIVQVVHVVAMALLSGVLLWMTYCVLYLCRGLGVRGELPNTGRGRLGRGDSNSCGQTRPLARDSAGGWGARRVHVALAGRRAFRERMQMRREL